MSFIIFFPTFYFIMSFSTTVYECSQQFAIENLGSLRFILGNAAMVLGI